MKNSKLQRSVIALALCAACMGVGATIPAGNQARGEVRGMAEQPAYERNSVPLLREISATLRQIDARLARLEATAHKIQASAASNARRVEAADPAENN